MVFSYSYYIYLWNMIPGKICKRLLHWPGSDIVQNLCLFPWRKLSLGLFIVKHCTLGRSHADHCSFFVEGLNQKPVLEFFRLWPWSLHRSTSGWIRRSAWAPKSYMKHIGDISIVTDGEISKTLSDRLAWLLKTDCCLGKNKKDSYINL